ncbi:MULTISPECIES: hypothetical protein [Amycolatopsis]|uniref:hypothetical protein n=1 Tax=Amycolatopsis TaxID=1813 RepID=UPI00106E45EB|nr:MULTISPECIES: hypothetical protein [Amycolatopsis]MCG3750485.1 hypothetical protein [Amycolatopsis sp. Poz14]
MRPTDRKAPTCDQATVMNRRLDELGRGGFTWTIAEPPDNLWGVVDLHGTMQVRISPRVPCSHMIDVINHEWVHTRQYAKYGDRTMQAYGDVLEPVADCGSRLLGSAYTPYLDQRGDWLHRVRGGVRAVTARRQPTGLALVRAERLPIARTQPESRWCAARKRRAPAPSR